MKNIDWISNLKIRGSWGVTGNQNIPAYSSPEKMNTYTYPIGGVTSVGIGAGNMPNPDLKWETTAITDIGIDLGVFNNRINFTADYYYKKDNRSVMEHFRSIDNWFRYCFEKYWQFAKQRS